MFAIASRACAKDMHIETKETFKVVDTVLGIALAIIGALVFAKMGNVIGGSVMMGLGVLSMAPGLMTMFKKAYDAIKDKGFCASITFCKKSAAYRLDTAKTD